MIPAAAVQRGAQGTVRLRREGRPDRDAAPGEARAGRRAAPGDRPKGSRPASCVVIDGVDRLRDGAKVEVTTARRRAQARRPTAPRARASGEAAPERRGRAAEGDARARRRPGEPPARDAPPMNPSRPFILRPVATSLLMVAILLAGLVAYRLLPLSALPQVDYPTIQVVTFYPGASPEVMTSSVTAPLERQFGQMPGLKQMSSTSSGGASVITLQFDLELALDVAEQEVQAAINAASNLLPAGPADAAGLQQGESGRRADPHARPHVEDAAAAAGAEPRRHAPRAEDLAGAGRRARHARPAASGPRCACRRTPRRSPRTGSASRTCAPRSPPPTSTRRRAASTARARAYTIDANDQLRSAAEYRDIVVAYRNGAPVCLSRRRRRDRGRRERAPRRLDERRAGGDRQHPAPARRQRDRGRRPHEAAAAAAAPRRCRRRSTSRCSPTARSRSAPRCATCSSSCCSPSRWS